MLCSYMYPWKMAWGCRVSEYAAQGCRVQDLDSMLGVYSLKVYGVVKRRPGKLFSRQPLQFVIGQTDREASYSALLISELTQQSKFAHKLLPWMSYSYLR